MSMLRRAWPLGVVLLLTACQTDRPPAEPTDFGLVLDTSVSHGLQNDPAYARKVAERLREGFLKSRISLGDRVVIYYLGESGPRELMAEIIPLDRAHRKEWVADELYRRIVSIPDRTSGGQETNLLYVLQRGEFRCEDHRGELWIASDGIPDDARDFSDWRGLIAGTASLPKPATNRFKSCARVRMLGLAVVAKGMPPISSEGAARLEQQWRSWFGLSDFQAISGF